MAGLAAALLSPDVPDELERSDSLPNPVDRCLKTVQGQGRQRNVKERQWKVKERQ